MRVAQPERHTGRYNTGIEYNAAGIGPHALTQRASYTVPSGRYVRVNSASVALCEASSPGASGIIQAYIDDGTRALVCILFQNFDSMSSPSSVAIGFAGYAEAGQGFRIYTADASVGSSVTYRIGLRLTEFSI